MGNKRALMHYYKQRLYGGRGAFAGLWTSYPCG